jgi:choline dehydrogenase-like flavoprotein
MGHLSRPFVGLVLATLLLFTDVAVANRPDNGPRKTSWDYIVVGSGAGGSTMAHKLAKDGTKDVLLLEEGLYACPGACQSTTGTSLGQTVPISDTNVSVHHPFAQAGGFGRMPYHASYHGLGGSTNMWGGVYNRASKEVLDTFYPVGFKYNDLLPYYKSMEDHYCHYISDANPGAYPEISAADCLAYHGKNGPMQVSPADYYEGFSSQMNATFSSTLAGNGNNSLMGMPASADCNGNPNKRAGLTYIQTYDIRANKTDRKSAQQRGSAYKGWLSQAFQDAHPNLQIVTGAKVLRLDITNAGPGGPRVRGVDYTMDGGDSEGSVRADRVILSMGVINTPKFLLDNGIGPASMLQAAGVPLVANNTNVGKRLMAHQALLTGYRTTSPVDANSGEHATMGHFYSNASALTSPDFQIGFGEGAVIENLGTYEAGPPKPVVVSTITNGGVPTANWLNVLIINNRPTTFGSVSINKRNPYIEAILDWGYDGTAAFNSDIDRWLLAVQNVRQFMLNLKFPNGTNVVQDEVYPGTLWYDNINKFTPNAQFLPDDLKKSLSDRFFVMNAVSPVYHITGTMSLGYATDLIGQVNGVRGLHVADNSVLPHAPDGNPSATTMAVVQKLADAILALDN